MPRSKVALLLVISLCLAAFPSTLAAAAAKGGKPLATAITKDPATLLYTSPLKDSRPLVLDLSGPLIWTTCDDASHPTLQCHHHDCAHAHSYHPPDCPHTGYGVADEEDRFRCKCTAHPYNPFTGKSATGDLTLATLSANATDGRNPLHPVSFPAVAACAPRSLLTKLPAGAAGVAGLASSRVALPAQVSRAQKLPDKFLLCLPRSGAGDGVAIFGGGPLFLTTITGAAFADDFTSRLTYTPLLRKRGSPSYYIPVKAIAVDKAQVQLPAEALATGGVVLSTAAPYTALRPDVYRPFVDAFDRALTRQSNSKRVAAVAPFELCYDSSTLPGPTRIGWLVPNIDLMLEGGKNWTFIAGLNTMVDVNSFTAACFAFVEMKPKKGGGGYGGAPAVEIGGFQMENHVLQFDLEKKQLGFTKLQIFTSCSNFNFTMSH